MGNRRIWTLASVATMIISACGGSEDSGVASTTSAITEVGVDTASVDTVISPDGVLTLDVSGNPGFTEEVTISEGSSATRDDLERAGGVVLALFEVGPSPMSFNEPVQLHFELARELLADGVTLFSRSEDGTFELFDDVAIELEADHVILTTTVSHFSEFGALQPPAVPKMLPSAVQTTTSTTFRSSLALFNHSDEQVLMWKMDIETSLPTPISEDTVEYQSGSPDSKGDWSGQWTCELTGPGTFGFVGTSEISALDNEAWDDEVVWSDIIGANQWTVSYEALGEATCQEAEPVPESGSGVDVRDRRCVDSSSGAEVSDCAEVTTVEVSDGEQGTVDLEVVLDRPFDSRADPTAQVEIFRSGEAPLALTCRHTGQCDLFTGVGFGQDSYERTITFHQQGSTLSFKGLPLGPVEGGGIGIKFDEATETSIGTLGPGSVPISDITIAVGQDGAVGSALLDPDSFAAAIGS